jgi:hypothetical protein
VLLDDLVTLATDDQQPITALLRKCIVLAHRLKNDRLKAWANEELNGYASIDTLPEYRILSAAATGTFVGPGWMQTTQGIPSGALKKQHQKFAETVYLSQPVSELREGRTPVKGLSLRGFYPLKISSYIDIDFFRFRLAIHCAPKRLRVRSSFSILEEQLPLYLKQELRLFVQLNLLPIDVDGQKTHECIFF